MKHTDGTSISALAKEYKISQETVRRYLKNNATMCEECEVIKKEAIGKVLENTFNELGAEASEILTLAFKQAKVLIPKASLRDVVGLMKILSDMRDTSQESDGENALDKLCATIKEAAKEKDNA
jgi:hypothetical protein